jgi:hypothetical protein
MTISLYGCAPKSSERYGDRDESKVAAEEPASAEAPQMDAAKEEAVQEEAVNSENPNISTEVGYNRKIIKTGNLSLQTLEFKKCVEDIVAKVQSLDGYVESSNVQGEDLNNARTNNRTATIKVRIPQKNFDSFINYSNHF